jgi:hypothetical protein
MRALVPLSCNCMNAGSICLRTRVYMNIIHPPCTAYFLRFNIFYVDEKIYLVKI